MKSRFRTLASSNSLKSSYYKEIICVLGNHDLHCLANRNLYLYDETKALFKDAGIHLLDGEIITIDGINIGRGRDVWRVVD